MIDVGFDFTTDTKGYWDGYWERGEGLGGTAHDPDSLSPTLKRYHQLLWSKELPNGEMMELAPGKGLYYLTWKDFDFGSDAIIVDFRYERYRHMIDKVRKRVGDYRAYYDDLTRRSYTIGGSMVFPRRRAGINTSRGFNAKISDRWDLTLECIRRYYKGEKSPLSSCFEKDREFFGLFVDFRGFVDFFLLQAAVSDDYSRVAIWCGKGDFDEPALPKDLADYFLFIEREYAFLEKRNKRIKEWADEHLL